MATTKKQKKAEDLPLGSALLQKAKAALLKRRNRNQKALKEAKKSRKN